MGDAPDGRYRSHSSPPRRRLDDEVERIRIEATRERESRLPEERTGRFSIPPREPTREEVRRVKRTPGKLAAMIVGAIMALGGVGGVVGGAGAGLAWVADWRIKGQLRTAGLMCPEYDPDARIPEEDRCKTLPEKLYEIREAQREAAIRDAAIKTTLDAVLRRLPQETP